MQYYAQIAPLDSHGLAGRYIWRHCLLYLNQPASVPASRQDVNPDDCLGVVWLHNPSSANRPNPVPPNWGKISVVPTEGDTLWTISTIMEAVADNVPANSIPQSAYLAIEELIYVDSTGVNELWDSLSTDQIKRFSILNEADAGPIRLAYPRSKFVWIAWGEKSHNASGGFVLPVGARLPWTTRPRWLSFWLLRMEDAVTDGRNVCDAVGTFIIRVWRRFRGWMKGLPIATHG